MATVEDPPAAGHSREGRYRSRKFWLAIAALVLAAIYLPLGYLNSADFTKVILAVVGAYNAGNVIAKWRG